MLLIHISDTHLGYRQYNLEEREKDFYEAFHQIVEQAIEEHPDLIVHTGDLFDSSRPTPRALLEATRAIKKALGHGIKVITIPGSHDMPKRRGVPPHALLEELGAIVLRSRRPYVVVEDTFIGGIEYTPRVFRNILLEKLKDLSIEASKYKKRILLLHQGIEQFLKFEHELVLDDIPKNFHYYALGHVHRRLVMDHGLGKLAYAGSTEVCSRDEYVDYLEVGKGAFLVDLSSDIPEVQRVDIDCIRPHLTRSIEARTITDLMKEVEIIRKEVIGLRSRKKPVLHIKVRGDVDWQQLRRLFTDRLSDILLTVRFETLSEEIEYEEIHIESINIRELIHRRLKDRKKTELAYTLFNLLSQGDVESAHNLIEEFLKGELHDIEEYKT
ncbi:MAG: hypothetical protein DRN53_05735 [Thermoprotei archaeon]|nr:MAG: hypothetical protein DRN53_05735 [Thermoprotei archaeon]